MPFKARDDIHLARRLWHFGGVLFIFALYSFVTPKMAVYLSVGFTVFMVGFDWARLNNPRLGKFFMWLFGPVLRESERKKFAASTGMMVGVTVIICFFPKPVVLLSLLFLAFADPLASYFGIRFGKDKLIGNKSLQGTLAAFAACFLLSLGYFSYMDLMMERQFIACLLAGLIGAFSELVPIWKLDDNFVFPVLSAVLLTGLYYVFGALDASAFPVTGGF